MAYYRLRELKKNTELLILAEFLRNPQVRRKQLAERLGVTEQAISQYIARLERERMIKCDARETKLTRKGIQLLQERLIALSEEIKEILGQIQVIDTCLAVADSAIKAREQVGLIMRDGRLFASPNTDSPSRGIVQADAKKGDEVLVSNLEGVVELKLGELLAIQLPVVGRGGSKQIDLEKVKKIVNGFRFDEIAIGDLIGDVVAKKLKLKPGFFHVPVEASISALSKGLNVLFLGTNESVREMLSEIEALGSRTGYKIAYRIITAPNAKEDVDSK